MPKHEVVPPKKHRLLNFQIHLCIDLLVFIKKVSMFVGQKINPNIFQAYTTEFGCVSRISLGL